MAAPNGVAYEDPTSFMGASDAGILQGEQAVLGRHTVVEATSLSPQFADPMVVGYAPNHQSMVKEQYDPPYPVMPSRASRMPHWFGWGVERIISVAEWPFLPNLRNPEIASWMGMSGAQLPRMGVGWDQQRKNIYRNESMPFGDLTMLYPHIYANALGVE